MEKCRVHKKVWVWWGDWWAIQFVNKVEYSFGVRIEPKRPLLDLFVGPVTIAFGRHPVLTHPVENTRHSGRGFFNGEYPNECVL
jgi:hypothetical protein